MTTTRRNYTPEEWDRIALYLYVRVKSYRKVARLIPFSKSVVGEMVKRAADRAKPDTYGCPDFQAISDNSG